MFVSTLKLIKSSETDWISSQRPITLQLWYYSNGETKSPWSALRCLHRCFPLTLGHVRLWFHRQRCVLTQKGGGNGGKKSQIDYLGIAARGCLHTDLSPERENDLVCGPGGQPTPPRGPFHRRHSPSSFICRRYSPPSLTDISSLPLLTSPRSTNMNGAQ